MVTRRRWSWVAPGLILAAVLATGANVLRAILAKQRPATAPAAALESTFVPRRRGHIVGAPRPQVLVSVFSDYRCPACRELWNRAESLLRRHPGKLALELRHNPASGPFALRAAIAAECAGQLGRFRDASEYLFESTRQSDDAVLRGLASRAGIIDRAPYEACLIGTATAAAVHADILDAQALGLAVTPVVIIGGQLYSGVPWDFEELVLSQVRH